MHHTHMHIHTTILPHFYVDSLFYLKENKSGDEQITRGDVVRCDVIKPVSGSVWASL